MLGESTRARPRPRPPGRATAFFALLHDDVVFVNDTYPLPDVGHQYQGRAAVEEFCRSYWGSFTDYAVEPVEVVEVGDRLVVVQRESGGGEGSGISLQRTFAVVFHVRDEKIVRIEPYRSSPTHRARRH